MSICVYICVSLIVRGYNLPILWIVHLQPLCVNVTSVQFWVWFGVFLVPVSLPLWLSWLVKCSCNVFMDWSCWWRIPKQYWRSMHYWNSTDPAETSRGLNHVIPGLWSCFGSEWSFARRSGPVLYQDRPSLSFPVQLFWSLPESNYCVYFGQNQAQKVGKWSGVCFRWTEVYSCENILTIALSHFHQRMTQRPKGNVWMCFVKKSR